MTRFFTLALLALGLAAAPVTVDGVTAAHAQKAKKTTKVTKTKKASKQAKSVFRGPVKKGTKATPAKKTAAKAAQEDEQKILFVKPAVRNTNAVLGQARQAVKAGAKGQQLLRDAVVRQHAARKANAAGQPRLAFYLTRAARGLAIEAIVLNGLKPAEEPKADGFVPTADDIAGVDEYITAVENENLVPPIDVIPNDETIGNDLPEDLGEDDGVVARPTSGPEVEVK
ncbi:MAG: hypothetical protein KC549_13520 [Myxococcales bacterium]|nr:hypothetical protein [Myxococcales bacterium]